MSRRWLGLLLLLSVGVNVGILSVLALERLRGDEAVLEAPAVSGLPDGPPAGALPGIGPPGPEGDGVPAALRWRLQELADRLGLERGERTEFLEIQRRFFLATRQRRARILELQERFRRELGADEPSHERIEALVGRLGQELAGLDADLASSVLETRALLGPEREQEYLRRLDRLRPGGPAGRPGPGLADRIRGPRRPPGQ